MTEEQRYKESIQIEKDKVQLLKRITEAIEAIARPYRKKEVSVKEFEESLTKPINFCSCADSTEGNPDNKHTPNYDNWDGGGCV